MRQELSTCDNSQARGLEEGNRDGAKALSNATEAVALDMSDSPPWGRLKPFPAVTRIRRIPLRATGGVAAPEPVPAATPLLGTEWPGWGLPGVGVVDLDSGVGVELWLFPESKPLSLNSARLVVL